MTVRWKFLIFYDLDLRAVPQSINKYHIIIVRVEIESLRNNLLKEGWVSTEHAIKGEITL